MDITEFLSDGRNVGFCLAALSALVAIGTLFWGSWR